MLIIHNSVTLDGSFGGFMPNMGLHYRIAGNFGAQARLIGSNTVRSGIEMFGGEAEPESPADFEAPARSERLPYWVVIDSRGALAGMLHNLRRFEYCRDVIVLHGDAPPPGYIKYLDERSYRHHAVGDKHVDLPRAIALLKTDYGVQDIVTDAGPTLTGLLIKQGLADRLSLLVHPLIRPGEDQAGLLGAVADQTELKLLKCEVLEEDYVWLLYEVGR